MLAPLRGGFQLLFQALPAQAAAPRGGRERRQRRAPALGLVLAAMKRRAAGGAALALHPGTEVVHGAEILQGAVQRFPRAPEKNGAQADLDPVSFFCSIGGPMTAPR